MQHPIRCALAAAMLGTSLPAAAASYSVTYNPYESVDWDTTLRCQSQHHDHAYDATRISALSNTGYCAVSFMTYSGDYRPQSVAAWIAAGSPNPDPGVPTGWGGYRRWPPQFYGAPVLPLNSLRFYLPGAEEVGLVGGTPSAQAHTTHMFSLGLMEYMEGVGCAGCGNAGVAVHTDNPFGLPPAQRYFSSSDFVAKATDLGAIVTLNHPTGPPATWDYISPYPKAIEIFNNHVKTNDEGTCGANASHQLIEAWDHVLQVKSARIWGVAANDWNSAWTPLGDPPVACWPQITLRNRDRGKLQVLLPSYDLGAYMAAFEAGAFFAVVEDNEIKAAYPTVTNVALTPSSISIITAAGNETITWIANGEVVGYGATLGLNSLPDDLLYARAEIDDGQGRTVYSQPFSLGTSLPPPPPGEPVPLLPPLLQGFLGLALLVILIRISRTAARG